jgi:hypothetical protein
MSSQDILYIVISAISVIFIPLLAWVMRLLIRGTQKWTNTENAVAGLVEEMKKLVADKDRTHAAMLEQMKEDRTATNRRLEFLERLWIERGNNGRAR